MAVPIWLCTVRDFGKHEKYFDIHLDSKFLLNYVACIKLYTYKQFFNGIENTLPNCSRHVTEYKLKISPNIVELIFSMVALQINLSTKKYHSFYQHNLEWLRSKIPPAQARRLLFLILIPIILSRRKLFKSVFYNIQKLR